MSSEVNRGMRQDWGQDRAARRLEHVSPRGPSAGSKEGTVRRTITLLVALTLMLGVFAGVASADEHIPPHGHMLIQGVVFGPGVPTYEKCVDLANNQVLPLHAHHEKVHFGTAGEALRTKAGHFVVPTTPFSGFEDCADLARQLGPPTR